MSNVSQATKRLKSLRIASEASRAHRAATRSGQNAGRTPEPPQGSEGSKPQSSKGNRKRRENTEKLHQLISAGSQRRSPAGGKVRALATLMKTASNKSLTHIQFAQNVKSFRKRLADGALPYKAHVEHEGLPVVTSIAHDKSRLSTEVSTRSVMTEYGPGVEFSGEEYLFSAATGAYTYGQGNTIVAFPLNPRVLTTPRLQLFSQLYTRFIFKDAELIYEHSAGAQNNGSICMFGVYDPTVNPCCTPGDGLIGYATNRHAAQSGVFEDVKVVMDDKHFKDMLFLQADDDLRWTMQGILYCISVGTIGGGLEMGQFKLRYKCIMANDDLDEEQPTLTRSYSGNLGTKGVGVVGAEVLLGNANAWPAGKYWVTVRNDPSAVFSVWRDRDSYEQNNVVQRYPFQKGMGFFMLLTATDAKIYHSPDLFAENGLGNGKGMCHGDTPANGTLFNVQAYKLSD